MRLVAEDSAEDLRHERNERQDDDGERDRPPDSLPEKSPAFFIVFAPKALADQSIDHHQHAKAEGNKSEGEHAGGPLRSGGIVAHAREHERVDEVHHRIAGHLRDGRRGQLHQLLERMLRFGDRIEFGWSHNFLSNKKP
jgi:hypothetical protein